MKINNIKKKIYSNIKRIYIKVSTAVILAVGLQKPVYAITPLQIPGMSDVATSLQNIILAVGIFFIAAGAFGLMHGLHKVFQSMKEQNAEARTTSMLEAGAGLGSIVVGAAASYFKAYIVMSS